MMVSVTCAEFWGKRMRQSHALFKVFRGHPVWGGEQTIPAQDGGAGGKGPGQNLIPAPTLLKALRRDILLRSGRTPRGSIFPTQEMNLVLLEREMAMHSSILA